MQLIIILHGVLGLTVTFCAYRACKVSFIEIMQAYRKAPFFGFQTVYLRFKLPEVGLYDEILREPSIGHTKREKYAKSRTADL